MAIENFYLGRVSCSNLAEEQHSFSRKQMHDFYVGGFAGVALDEHRRGNQAPACHVVHHLQQQCRAGLKTWRFTKEKK